MGGAEKAICHSNRDSSNDMTSECFIHLHTSVDRLRQKTAKEKTPSAHAIRGVYTSGTTDSIDDLHKTLPTE